MNYSLCLEIYTALAETEYVNGAYDEMSEALNEVFKWARSFDDRLPAYHTLIRAKSSQNYLDVAISKCFEVLEELGESFAEEVDPAQIMKECRRIKAMLEGKDKAWLMKQNVMTDGRMLNRMKYMHMMILYLYYAKPLKLPLVACRMIELSLQHGICRESAMAFSAHALVCCSFLGDYEGGYQIGCIATAIVEKFNARELVGRINMALCACVNVWTQPLQSTLPLLEYGYDAAISSGDPEYALICTQVHTMNAFLCGQPLEGIVENLSRLTKECNRHRMDLVTAVIFPLWQCIENLIGDSKHGRDPTVLDGAIIQGDAYVDAQLGLGKGNYKASIFQYYFMKLILAYTFERDELAAEMYDKCMEFDPEKNARGRPTIFVNAFYGALAALSMERRDPSNPKWKGIIDAVMPRMEMDLGLGLELRA